MTFKNWDALLATAQELAITQEGFATGGSTTTLIDTNLRLEDDDFWNYCTLWYVDTNGANSYNNYCVKVLDFDQGTSTLTFATQTAAPASGDRYIIGKPKYTKDMLQSAVNSVLNTAPILDLDETVSIAANQTEYTLPTTVLRGNLIKVMYQTNTGDTNDNRWEEIRDWSVVDSDTGTADTLHLFQQYVPARTLQLRFVVNHPSVTAISDSINEIVSLEGLAIRAAIWCMRARMMNEKRDQWAVALINDLIERRSNVPLVKKTYSTAILKKPYIEVRSNV